MLDRRVALAAIAAALTLVAGCAQQRAAPPLQVARPEPEGFPAAYYQQLRAQGQAVFRVDPARSLLLIEVRRAGSLAAFGHDHVVASHDTAGRVAPDEGRADLWLPLEALVVDEAALRKEAGFDTQPSADDIAGTRSNMLNKVLETDRYPYARIAVAGAASGVGAQPLQVSLTLRGITRSVDTVAQVERTAAAISVTGAIEIEQSQFGITPFSIFGGAIAVQDRLKISIRIHADRID